MYLTALEIWIACDQAACRIHPLLFAYDPEVPLHIFFTLTLLKRIELERLTQAEKYIQLCSGEKKLPSIFRDFGHPGSFAVQQFYGSKSLQKLHQKIIGDATEQKQQKCNELLHYQACQCW